MAPVIPVPTAEVVVSAPVVEVAPAPVYVEEQPQVDVVVATDFVEVSPGVQVIADYDEPIFFNSGLYWRNDGGIWYSSRVHTGGWGRVDAPPEHIRAIARPTEYQHYRPSGYVRREERPNYHPPAGNVHSGGNVHPAGYHEPAGNVHPAGYHEPAGNVHPAGWHEPGPTGNVHSPEGNVHGTPAPTYHQPTTTPPPVHTAPTPAPTYHQPTTTAPPHSTPAPTYHAPPPPPPAHTAPTMTHPAPSTPAPKKKK